MQQCLDPSLPHLGPREHLADVLPPGRARGVAQEAASRGDKEIKQCVKGRFPCIT